MTSHLHRLWVIGSYEMPRCDWLQHCNFLAGIEILPIALQTACKPCGFAAWRPAIVAGPVLRVAIGESCSVCRALKCMYIIVFMYICNTRVHICTHMHVRTTRTTYTHTRTHTHTQTYTHTYTLTHTPAYLKLKLMSGGVVCEVFL